MKPKRDTKPTLTTAPTPTAESMPTPQPGTPCPRCGQELLISEGDPHGRPMCIGVTRKPGTIACSYVGAATKTPPPPTWGAKHHAFIAAVEAWLAKPQTIKEVEAMIADSSLLYQTCGYAPLAWKEATKLLKAGLKERELTKEGQKVNRIGDEVKAAVAESMKPFLEPMKIAAIEATPPINRKWWQNIRACYNRQTGTETQKWRKVAHTIITAVHQLKGKPPREQSTEYLSPIMLKHLLAKLSKPGVDVAAVEREQADGLRRKVAQAESKIKAPGKI